LKKYLLDQSLAVRTYTLPEVRNTLEALSPTYDNVKSYTTCITEWLKPIINLSEFHVYPTNGITEGLNWWSMSSEYNIWREEGDYQWVDLIQNRKSPDICYQSIPSSIDGNFKNIRTDAVVALDLAYIGSTTVRKIEIPNNVEYVFYSLSKSFGVSNIRTGWYFTRKPDKKLESLVYNAKYYNYFAHACAESIINNFDIDYVYNMLYYKQKQICNELNFMPSDSVWLATTTDLEYIKFRRKGNIARICLSGVYNEKT
jgi:hypothetical protein